jgi:ABC-type antimicrobial peptide transport system permease subunit
MPNFTAFTAWMLAHPGSNDWLEVIAVVGDTPNRGLSERPGPALYVPYSLVLGDSFNLAIRTHGDPLEYANVARKAIHAVNASQPVNEIRTAEQRLADEGWAVERFIASLFLLFSIVAVALSAIGVYSVVAFVTEMRRQEFGIRVALGAQRSSIVKLVLLSGARTLLLGLLGGLALCAVANALQRWIKGSLHDPALLLPVSLGLALIVMAASWLPAWRGACVDPLRALRENSD